MYCPKCGNTIPDNSRFCDKCGCSISKGDISAHTQAHHARTNNASSKVRSWIENLNLSKFQRINTIIALCAAALLLICIDGSIYMWLYAIAAVGVLIAVVKKFSYKHIFSAIIPSIMLLAYIITDFVNIGAGQRLQAINIIMQIIFACAVAILWILTVHPKFQDKNKTTAILMIVSMSCIAVTAIFLLISFFIYLRYIGVYFRAPIGNLGNCVALVSYGLFLSDEGKTIEWIKGALNNAPTAQHWKPVHNTPAHPSNALRNTPKSSASDEIVCQVCGSHLPVRSKFCDNCGSSLKFGSQLNEFNEMEKKASEEEGIPSNIVDTEICPSCGNEIDGDSTFCEFCGAEVSFPVVTPNSETTNYNNSEHEDYRDCVENKVTDAQSAAQLLSDTYSQDPEVHVPYEMPIHNDPSYNQPDSPIVNNVVDERLGFLNFNAILVDEKLSVLKFANAYRVYDLEGNNVGSIEQVNVSGGAKAARLLLGSSAKGLQQFHYKLLDKNGKQLAAVHRDGGAFSQIRIVDSEERTVGTLNRGKVYSPDNNLLCSLKSDWKGWNLTLKDPNDNPIGEVKKKWNGVGKELFTSADKYYVSLESSVAGDTRIAIFGTAIIYDILLHET